MTTHAPTPHALSPEVVEPPFPPALIEELLKLLVKAIRAHQLYLPNNPVYQRAIENLRRGFGPVWQHTDEFGLTIGENDFRWEGRIVMHETNKTESLPWLFFKDGIRELRLSKEVEGEEIVSLLEILKRVKKASPEEDDLLTLLWEKDFVHLRYRFIDLALEAAQPIEPSAEMTQRTEVPPPAQIEEAEETKNGIVRMEDLDTTVHFLDESEIEYLRTEVRKEYEGDPRRNVLSALLDTFELQTAKPVRDEILDILENFMLHLLSAGQFRAVAYVLQECGALVSRARELDPTHRQKLVGLPDRLSAPATLANVIQSMDEAEAVPNQEELNALFEQLRSAALGTVFSFLGKLEHADVRVALQAAAARLASANIAELVKCIGSGDPVVALEAAKRAGALKTAAAAQPLGKLLGHGEPAMRLAAVQSLAEIASPAAMQQLERAVEDDDRDVRVTAVRVLATRGHRAALAKVESAVRGRAMKEADLTEKMAFFEAYAALAGASAVSTLDQMLNAKGLIGRREDPETRACAAMALGKVRNNEAMNVLAKAQQDKDVLVRNAVNRAMRDKS